MLVKNFFSFFLIAIFFSCSEESITKSSSLNIEFTFKNSWTTFDGNLTNYVPRSELLPDLNLKIFDNNNLVKTLLISQKSNGNYISVSTKLEYGSYTFILDDNLTSEDEKDIGFSHELIIRESSANITIESEVQTVKLVINPAVWLLSVKWYDPNHIDDLGYKMSDLKFSLTNNHELELTGDDYFSWVANMIDLEKCRVNGENESEYFIFMNYFAQNIAYYLAFQTTDPNSMNGSVLRYNNVDFFYYETNKYDPQIHLSLSPKLF